jgi:hypothetical protein
MSNSPWEPFNGLAILTNYDEDSQNAFIQRLTDGADPKDALEFIEAGIKFLEKIKSKIHDNAL